MIPPRDVDPAVYQQQLDMIRAMTPAARFEIGMRWIEMGRQLLEARLRAEHPGITPGGLVVAVFEACHGHLYTEDMKIRIRASILAAHGE
ncbi:MAG: hypothetical protein SF053_17640 [Bacteroidia bacterium]|nr:hypothetical protein [Bacteroidia bacterium]